MTLEAVLVLPVLLVSIMAIVQVVLLAHASRLADAAAREGTRALRLSGQVDDGRLRAEGFLQQHGAQMVLEPVVVARSVDTLASVDVFGRAVAVVPGLSFPVRGHSTGPVELFLTAARG